MPVIDTKLASMKLPPVAEQYLIEEFDQIDY